MCRRDHYDIVIHFTLVKAQSMSILEHSYDLPSPNRFDLSQVSFIAEVSESPNENNDNLHSALIPDAVWNNRIQDKGRLFHDLGNKSYRRNKIIGVGSGENKIYYYELMAIAVDFAQILRTSKHRCSHKCYYNCKKTISVS